MACRAGRSTTLIVGDAGRGCPAGPLCPGPSLWTRTRGLGTTVQGPRPPIRCNRCRDPAAPSATTVRSGAPPFAPPARPRKGARRERSAHLAVTKRSGGRSNHRPIAPECSPFVFPSSLSSCRAPLHLPGRRSNTGRTIEGRGPRGPEEDAPRPRAAGPFRDARLGLQLVSLDDGSVVFSKDADALMNPASNVKLVTAAAALARLGPEYRFDTEFLVEPGPSERVKTLWVRGKGDPSITTERLHAMASELSHLGLREVGELVLDDTWFDAERLAPGFEQDISDRAYTAPTGALSLNANAVGVYLRASSPGGRAVVELEPPRSTSRSSTRPRVPPAGLAGRRSRPSGPAAPSGSPCAAPFPSPASGRSGSASTTRRCTSGTPSGRSWRCTASACAGSPGSGSSRSARASSTRPRARPSIWSSSG